MTKPLVQQGDGHATGWNVYFSPLMKRWQWSAYGPNGSTHGTASDEAEAKSRAVAARDNLNWTRRTDA